MIARDPNPISLSTLLRALKNHWGAAASVFLATVLLAALAIIFLPRKYISEAMIFVRLGRETVSLDPTAATGSTISVLESRDNEINSVRDMLYSRGIVEKVVDRLGPDVVLGDEDLIEENIGTYSAPETDYRNSPRQQAIKFLLEETDIISSRKSSVLILQTRGATPELAQRMLKEYVDVYQAMHTVAHQTPKSNKFFEEQARLLRGQWQETMKALQIAKEDAGVVSIGGARDNLKAQTNAIESRLMTVDSSLLAIQAKVERFDSLIQDNPLDQQRVRGSYLESKAQLSSLTAERDSLKTQLGELLDRAAKLNRDEVSIGQLEKQVDLSASNFAQYQELYEQTRIEEALNNNRFTNVRVVQEPTFVPKAVSPSKTLIAAAGLFAGTSGGVLLAFLLEILSMQTQRPEEEETDLEREVLENNEFLDETPVQREVLDSANG